MRVRTGYQPETCVWEMTTKCNLRCLHCASSCDQEREEELDTGEAMNLAGQIADMGVRWISLTGGELLLRNDWDEIAAVLEERGVRVHMITNGLLIGPEVAERIKKASVSMVTVSLDGTEPLHDRIRRRGSYRESCAGLQLLQEKGIRTGCITSVMQETLPVLMDLKEELVKMGVERWQLQMAVPEGNMCRITEALIKPEQMQMIIDRAWELGEDGRIQVVLPDNVGYYTEKETSIRSRYRKETVVFQGCNAGIRSFGIMSNGDIVGCTSMRGKEFTEGNIRTIPLREIWDSPDAFLWRRKLTPERLGGKCETCRYAGLCLGGCSNTRYTVNGSVNSENPYCAYHAALA